MVKNNRKGLGRGLNSLLGDSYEEEIKDIVPENIRGNSNDDEIQTMEGNVLIRKVDKKPTSEEKTKTKPKEEIKVKGSIIEININDIVPNTDQPRTNFDKEELQELASSIKKNGLLQPILVTKNKEEKYEIIAGERRWRACKLAGYKKVSVIVKDADKDKKLELALIENIQRKDLNPIEEAYCYKKIMDTQGISQNDVAALVSKGRSTITNALRLLNLPEEAQKLLYENKISAGHARAILSVNTDMGKKKLTQKIVEDNLSVREAEAMANLLSGQSAKALTTKKPAAPKSYKMVAKELKNYFGNQVKIKRAKGKNKIEIDFKDETDLKRIYELITTKEI